MEFPFRERDDGAGNRDFATSILDEAAIFLAVAGRRKHKLRTETGVANGARVYTGTRGKKKATERREI